MPVCPLCQSNNESGQTYCPTCGWYEHFGVSSPEAQREALFKWVAKNLEQFLSQPEAQITQIILHNLPKLVQQALEGVSLPYVPQTEPPLPATPPKLPLPEKLQVEEFSRGFDNVTWSDRLERWVSGGFREEIAAISSTTPVPTNIQEAVMRGDFRINDNYPPEEKSFALIARELDHQAVLAVATRQTDDKNRPLVAYRYFWLETDHPDVDKLRTLVLWWHGVNQPCFKFEQEQETSLRCNQYQAYPKTAEELKKYGSERNAFAAKLTVYPQGVDSEFLTTIGRHHRVTGGDNLSEMTLHCLAYDVHRQYDLQSREQSLAWAWNVRLLEHVDRFVLIHFDDTFYQRATENLKKWQKRLKLPEPIPVAKQEEVDRPTHTNYNNWVNDIAYVLPQQQPAFSNQDTVIIKDSNREKIPIAIKNLIDQGYFQIEQQNFSQDRPYSLIGRDTDQYSILAVAWADNQFPDKISVRFYWLEKTNVRKDIDGVGTLLEWWRAYEGKSEVPYRIFYILTDYYWKHYEPFIKKFIDFTKKPKCSVYLEDQVGEELRRILGSRQCLHAATLRQHQEHPEISTMAWAWNTGKLLYPTAFTLIHCTDDEAYRHNLKAIVPIQDVRSDDPSKKHEDEPLSKAVSNYQASDSTNLWSDLREKLFDIARKHVNNDNYFLSVEDCKDLVKILKNASIQKWDSKEMRIPSASIDGRFNAIYIAFLIILMPNFDDIKGFGKWLHDLIPYYQGHSSSGNDKNLFTVQDKFYSRIRDQDSEIADQIEINIKRRIAELLVNYYPIGRPIQAEIVKWLLIKSSCFWLTRFSKYSEQLLWKMNDYNKAEEDEQKHFTAMLEEELFIRLDSLKQYKGDLHKLFEDAVKESNLSNSINTFRKLKKLFENIE
jgi:hypothetical protein